MGETILETPRLRLRRLEEGDFPALCAILQDAETMAAYEGPFTDEEARQWLENQWRRYREDGFGLWAVLLRETGEMIGQCGVTLQDWEGRRVPEVGYLFQRAHWHQGYATEAAAACRDHAFGPLGFSGVYSIIRDSNTASQKVAVRCGMRRVGQFVKQYRGVEMPHYVYLAGRDEAVE